MKLELYRYNGSGGSDLLKDADFPSILPGNYGSVESDMILQKYLEENQIMGDIYWEVAKEQKIEQLKEPLVQDTQAKDTTGPSRTPVYSIDEIAYEFNLTFTEASAVNAIINISKYRGSGDKNGAVYAVKELATMTARLQNIYKGRE